MGAAPPRRWRGTAGRQPPRRPALARRRFHSPPPPATENRSPLRRQVAGVNYLVHVHVAGVSWTIKINKPLPHTGKPPSVMECTAGNAVDAS